MFFSFLINGQIWAIFVETGEYAQLLFRWLSTKPSMITFQRMKLSADLRQIRYEFKKNWMCNVIVIAFTGNNTATNKNEKRKIIPQQGWVTICGTRFNLP